MAVKGSLVNLADVRREESGDDTFTKMVEILAQENAILQDIPYIECNQTMSHKTSVRTGYPTPAWRSFNEGVATSKSSRAVIEFTCGQMAGRSEVDKDLADLGGKPNEFRFSESTAYLEAMAQEMASTLFYGNEALTPNKFTGLSRYYSALSGADTSEMIVNAGGSGSDNTSIWLIGWGENTVHGIYPKGLMSGLEHRDEGVEKVFDANSKAYYAYVDTYKWNNGLALRDWRKAGRIANIDVSDIRGFTTSDTAIKNLVDYLIVLIEKVDQSQNQFLYMNRTVRSALRLGMQRKIINNLTWESVAGKRVDYFDGIPIRRVDQLLLTEAAVS